MRKICPCNYEDKMRQHELNPSDFPSSAINSEFSIRILKTASKKSVGFNSLFYKFYSGTFLKRFFMIATATTTTLCLNYNPMFPFLRLFFLKMLLLVNTQTNHETACNIF